MNQLSSQNLDTVSCSTSTQLRLDGRTVIELCNNADEARLLFIKNDTLLFVVQGTIGISYGLDNYLLREGQMALLKRDILVGLEVTAEKVEGARLIVVHLTHDTLLDFVKTTQLSTAPCEQPFSVTVDSMDERLERFLHSLDLYLSDAGQAEEHLTKLKLLEMLFILERSSGLIFSQLLDLRRHYRGDITSAVEDNLMNPLSLSELAMLSGRSLSSFRRDFLAIYNMTPSAWLRQRRLQKAREMLLNTTMTVSDVCYTLGFESLAHFSRLFKNQYGYPPSRAREALVTA